MAPTHSLKNEKSNKYWSFIVRLVYYVISTVWFSFDNVNEMYGISWRYVKDYYLDARFIHRELEEWDKLNEINLMEFSCFSTLFIQTPVVD